ncbi:alpha/beta hydrolase [Deinococcus sp. 12RED42]|uniref:alpha/beta hydrolase n=1 Tax=Deinococcus sp. 12RED42 TaxID=2745872 RepID=UPI001E2E5BBF|nr:alpha/beta hydrolase [Deinococcus sp. 12RED42]MCD0164240.1 hypothetical protein [Deinococcus sp. 12RED42]
MAQAYIIETKQGNLKVIERLHSSNARTTVEKADVLAAVEKKKVLLHIHGGLVPRDAAIDSAHRLSQTHSILGAHYLADRADVQLYLVWPAGVLDALDNILKDSVFGKIVEAVKGWVDKPEDVAGSRSGKSALVKGIRSGALPRVEQALTQHYRITLRDITAEERRTTALVQSAPEETDETDETGKRFISVLTITKIAVQATLAIIQREDMHPDSYELEAMVREEVLSASGFGDVGRLIWRQLKDTATEHATNDFLTFLQKVYDECSALTLVGHSTGANLITALIPKLTVPGLTEKKLRVIFLAPAVTVQAFTDQIGAFEKHLQSPLRIYTMAHDVEIQDTSVPFYKGSLLQLVNFVFEDPRPGRILGLAHYALSKKANFGSQVEFHTDHKCITHGGFHQSQALLNRVL